MKRAIFFVCCVVLVFSHVFSQSGGSFEIKKSVIAGGGGRSFGGVFVTEGTLAEALAGLVSSGGTFTIAGGFWGGGSLVTPTPTPTNTPTATPTNTPTATPTATPTLSPTPTPSCVTDPVVTTNADSGAGSLRQAVANACAGSTITFAPGPVPGELAPEIASPIVLTSGHIVIDKNLTINGPGADLLTISGNNSSRIFLSGQPGFVVAISGLTITAGNAQGGSGGAVINDGGDMTLTSVVISSSTATFNGGAIGIFNAGNTSLIGCTVRNNSAGEGAGGVLKSTGNGTLNIIGSTISNNVAAGATNAQAGGGVELLNGQLNVSNSTISGNSVSSGSSRGGGIMLQNGTAVITASTITNNSVPAGSTSAGGVFQVLGGLTFRNTLIAGNSNNGGNRDIGSTSGVFGNSSGYNIIGDVGTATFFPNNGDQVGTSGSPISPLLGPLAGNGGPTQTHALLPGSPAIDKGNSFGLTTDQRGSVRPVDDPGISNVGDGSDIGAFEVQLSGTPTPTNTPTATPTNTPTATPTGSPTPLPAGFEADVSPRPDGNGSVVTGDVVQMRRFVTGLDTIDTSNNEFQRADSAPRLTFGDGILGSGDVTQTRRYATGLDSLTPAGGPTAAGGRGWIAWIGELFIDTGNPRANVALVEASRSDRDEGKSAYALEIDAKEDVYAALIKISYDPANGKPLITPAVGLPEGTILTINDTVDGELVILVDSSVAFAGGGKPVRVFEIAFERPGPVKLMGVPSISDLFGNNMEVYAFPAD